MMRRALAALWLSLIAALAAAPAADTALHPLERPVRLSLWGAGLNDAARDILAQTGVEVRYFLADLPPDRHADTVFLVTGRVPLGTALEALARCFGFRYRVTEAGVVECSRSYDWVAPDPALAFPRLVPLVDGGPDAVRRFLGELVKALPVLPGDHTLAVEPYPLPDRPDALRATAVLPPVLAEYLERAVRCLEGESGDYPYDPRRPGATRLFARAQDRPADWAALLGRTVVRPRGRDARELLADAAEQAGVAIALQSPPKPDGRELPFDVERYTLGRLAESLADIWHLGKRVFLAGGAVVFERGGSGYETDARSRQLFWDGLAVAGFDPRRLGGGEAAMALIRREIFPGVWRDPVCALQYSPRTGRLAVVAPANVVDAIGARLDGGKNF